jgi:outer membrane protein assembly factor BamB
MGTSTTARNWRRITAVAVAGVLVTAAAATITYRVLAPAEVSTPARVSYEPVKRTHAGVRGTFPSAPLIVDGRLRVFATTRQVSADQPIGAKTKGTPFWSYRRWPEQVTGVIAGDGPTGPIVVSQWSNGELVALDARTGRVAWRSTGSPPDGEYAGRRTGASTVYAPAGLHLAGTDGGASVLTVTSRADLRGLDPATGRELWRVPVRSACRADELATTAGRLVAVDTCGPLPAVEFRDVTTGAVTRRWQPEGAGRELEISGISCANGRSGCRAIRTTGAATSRGWLVDQAEPVAVPALDPAGAMLVGDLSVAPEGSDVVARTLTGRERWRRTNPTPVRVLAVQPGRVHLLNRSNELITLDSASGAERSRFDLRYGDGGMGWAPGYAYAAAGFVAVERLAKPVDPAAKDAQYYAAARPVIFSAT